ncbi:MAG: 50S ribosomal protein L3 [Candidatus Taylorbacteria bacterium RIFCSPHIGHO2_02_FULL_47_18]|uniref:Large ribosomal subunit protein uL3 n=1 Tax=Candidatus Taylorbacteria bacterium RIFCSPLOWO2_01_FULL_48_100 TaxID=1802322 RepID=A0A1G2NGB2_9BACT|nr:MAG: 50S ribosomal protein L3 [Candidatus Taylorbacteria bacterium RIFCSPHIGHO2_01_FULL_48_38]OHA27695.1 MAG: 50S ribosomal protein L3 [Candidatus Taylorbacteria bacterium RIFCSPHIGHO2_02_FULL_47_18]OHA35115.1 MAG: 50S ribosomal protein L3 [Candidatus Taylorbacteria bacterium RIFCSPLOWO2_01_FULL_48_100]OHA41027.1 MAG: 50S ribosomal protein L3 [Candidatus Taylorbacteria bacterium RIFCSPLOWO2_02_FULL_48_16]OHA44802.1 MAG: 50S ribosomal protein L3 [Candidatus Taylorbacteria bacterium RIFCSPLOWO
MFKTMKYILGTKINMSQIWDERGRSVPVTLLAVSPNVITQVKTKETDGYDAVQVGFGVRKAKNLTKPEKGHMKTLGSFQILKEWRLAQAATEKVGDKIEVSVFKSGDIVAVSGISKGKGFQGVVKRHGFHGGSRTHGQKHSEREPGAIGGRGRAGGRVSLGMRMAGRMGGERVTVKNLEVAQVIPDENLILLKGAVPGRRGSFIEIRG